jgi:hypothetical protein
MLSMLGYVYNQLEQNQKALESMSSRCLSFALLVNERGRRLHYFTSG